MSDSASLLDQWLAQEQAVLANQPASGEYPLMAADFTDLPGLDHLQALIDGRCAPPPISETLDFLLVEATPGKAVFQGEPKARHYNPIGSVHGGWFATLLDSAVGCAVHTKTPAGKAYTTLELKLNMIRPLFDGIGRVRAEGHCIHVGRQTATAEGKLVGPDGKLYAHATTTCLIFDRPS
ncbi:MAG: PaaI family thioesterase [Burkholderiaceae bacterium]